jgi:hypothetical protein
MAISRTFHIQHWSSAKFVHPHGGQAGHDTGLVTYDGAFGHTLFYLDFREGPWGYLVSSQWPTYCVHPRGGAVDAGNDTGLLFHEDRHPGAYFTINPDGGTIQHISGRYWHPHGGSAQPGNQNGIVIFDGYRDATKFMPHDGTTPVTIDLPVSTSSIGWRLVFAENNPLADMKRTYKAKVGQTVSKTTSTKVATTFKAEMEGQLFGNKSKASLEVKTEFSQTDAKTWTQEQEQDVEYDIKKGNPIAVWQRRFTATFSDGSVWDYGSGSIFIDTVSSNTRPT